MALPPIKGNIQGTFRRKQDVRNARGENDAIWVNVATVIGILDFNNQPQTERIKYSAKMEESTHIWFCDYFPMDIPVHELRFYCRGHEYDVLILDEVQFQGQHYEVWLKLVTP